MTAKTSDWRPGPTVCRCCLTEGCYKDISTEYFWMGKREVYAEMLTDTLNVSIGYAKSGPNSNSRLICEPCISRLRDAHDFRRQVLECEKTFMQHLDPGSTNVLSDMQLTLEEVKIERVKQEKKISDDEDFDDRVDFVVNDDSDDDMDNEPLMKLASKVPKKEKEADLLELLDSSQITVKRKSTASSSKAKEPPAKKAKKREIVIKPSASKATASASKAGEKKKKEQNPLYIVRRNAHMVIESSTAYPFKLPDNSMACIYCSEEFEDPACFRRHMREEHHDFKIYSSFYSLSEYFVKVDCTELRCRICSDPFDNLEDVAMHLSEQHQKIIRFDHDLGMIPFKIEKDRFECTTCGAKYANLRLLSKHMNTHYVKYTCESCGKSYSASATLLCHIRNSCGRSDSLPFCRRCKKSFGTVKERMNHLMLSKRCCQHLCNVCGERFPTWGMKQTHMRETHNAPVKTYTCPECAAVFHNNDRLRTHFTIEHTKSHFQCTFCELKFASEYTLKRHVVIHTGAKMFTCSVCAKSFSRRSGLRQHMWIHSEIKKHSCKICNKHFNQRVSWKTHMKSRHPEKIMRCPWRERTRTPLLNIPRRIHLDFQKVL